MTTTASELIRLLEAYAVSQVFGIPGVHTLMLYSALGHSAIKHVTTRHEQGAGFAADGYARVSDKPGVCFIISGPGMTNIVTAMGQAYSESIPMLVISSVNSHGHMGSGDGWLHELPDQRSLVQGVCAFSHTLHHPAELAQVLARAFAVFDSQRPRPVHIEIPINVLEAKCQPFTDTTLRLSRPSADPASLLKAARVLANASQPVLLVGGGACRASEAIAALAEQLDAPVVMSVNARGILRHDHPLAVSASASLAPVRSLIACADVVVGIGTEMGPTDYDFNEDGLFKLPGTFIRIDIDAQQLVRNVAPQIGLIGDSKAVVLELVQAVSGLRSSHTSTATQPLPVATNANVANVANANAMDGSQRAATTVQATLASFSTRERCYLATLACIRESLPDVILVGDSTQLIYAGNSAFGMPSPSSWFNSAMGFGTLGYALPAAIGAALATRQRPVVAISGDGGLQFCLSELATASDEQLKLILIVHENGGYQEISQQMQSNDIAPIGVDLLVPDLMAIATACGWRADKLVSLDQLSSLLITAWASSGPVLLVIPDAVFDAVFDA